MSYFGIPIRNGVPIGLGALAPLASQAAAAPSLSLNFTSGALDSRITFTRASTATYFNSAGVLTSAAINEARFDYNPTTLTALGLLIEEQRTNLLLRSETFATSPWFNAGLTSIANNTTDVVSPSGTNTATKIVSPGGAAAVGQGKVLTAEIYTASIWLRTLTGTVNTDFIVYLSGAPFTNIGTQAITITSTWQRFTLTTTTATAASYNFQLNNINAGTIYAWGAQLEAGAFPTSYIPTTAAAATRAADVAVMTGTNFSSWYNATEGTLYASIGSARVNNTAQFAWELNDNLGGGLGRIFTRRTGGGQIGMAVVVGGVSQLDIASAAVVAASATYKVACAFKTNDFALSLNGAVAVTISSGTLPSTIAALFIGQNYFSAQLVNGYIRSIAYYPRRLSNVQLQALTV